jgi:geranylgeranyl pyrophosphate synthase
VQDALGEAKRLVDQAKRELSVLPSGAARDLLSTLADTVIHRRF